MADWAGAVAAMRARFAGAFTAAPISYQNEDPPADPWPPAPAKPWVYFEVIQAQTALRGVGLPGSQTWLTTGHIFVHVFAPKSYALPDHLALAGQAGAIFRSATFYNAEPGAKVVCFGPTVQGGDSASEDGNWFGVTVAIPFEFYSSLNARSSRRCRPIKPDPNRLQKADGARRARKRRRRQRAAHRRRRRREARKAGDRIRRDPR
jgi:hypothetical protein